jgi:SAM-dependent methyltransferase
VRVETFGERGAPPILLVGGSADLCRLLAAEGRFVIRHDPGAGAREEVDVLAGGRAHVVDLSEGGALARRLAVEHPERVTTLTLLATEGSDERGLPAPVLVVEGRGEEVAPAILRHTDHRVRFAQLFADETLAHDERFRAAVDIGPTDRVLDIGCGTGGTTREAARKASAGSAVGVDISGVGIEEAQRLSEAEGLGNVTFLRADAQVHPFPPAWFDLCISRYGVMFFADPVAAFTNIAAALRPGARLVLLVWQARDREEASPAIRQALGATAPPASEPGSDPYSLGDPETAEAILAAAGFTDVAFEDVHEPVCYGPDAATAEEFALGLHETRGLLAALDPAEREQARGRLRALFAAHETENGVLFDARTWIITARRR